MKRLLKVIAVIGGLAGLIWAMRERLISIPTAREPEPPVFRTTEDGKPLVET
ncbi:MAG: hypothetical protein ACRDWH_04020 [Acidimicrobiia bacterium]